MEKMMRLEFEKVYPSHGKPFTKEQLIKCSGKLKIRLYPLKHADEAALLLL